MTVEDVDQVYQNELLGPSGQNDLVHYETRLNDGLDDDGFSLAMEILAEAAVVGQFDGEARRLLTSEYQRIVENVTGCITTTLEVLMHDGYLEEVDGAFRFPSQLLRDWWFSRFRDHHVPLRDRQQSTV